MKVHSRGTLLAAQLLGRLIKVRRLELKITAQDLAGRASISRALLYRIEAGDPACSIGAVFEVAMIVQVPLFEDASSDALAAENQRHDRLLALLPSKNPFAPEHQVELYGALRDHNLNRAELARRLDWKRTQGIGCLIWTGPLSSNSFTPALERSA